MSIEPVTAWRGQRFWRKHEIGKWLMRRFTPKLAAKREPIWAARAARKAARPRQPDEAAGEFFQSEDDASMDALKILLNWRVWGKSRMLMLGAVLALFPVIDAAFFTTDIGAKLLAGFLWLVNLQAIWVITPDMAVNFLVGLLGGLVIWLRAKTTQPLSQK